MSNIFSWFAWLFLSSILASELIDSFEFAVGPSSASQVTTNNQKLMNDEAGDRCLEIYNYTDKTYYVKFFSEPSDTKNFKINPNTYRLVSFPEKFTNFRCGSSGIYPKEDIELLGDAEYLAIFDYFMHDHYIHDGAVEQLGYKDKCMRDNMQKIPLNCTVLKKSKKCMDDKIFRPGWQEWFHLRVAPCTFLSLFSCVVFCDRVDNAITRCLFTASVFVGFLYAIVYPIREVFSIPSGHDAIMKEDQS